MCAHFQKKKKKQIHITHTNMLNEEKMEEKKK